MWPAGAGSAAYRAARSCGHGVARSSDSTAVNRRGRARIFCDGLTMNVGCPGPASKRTDRARYPGKPAGYISPPACPLRDRNRRYAWVSSPAADNSRAGGLHGPSAVVAALWCLAWLWTAAGEVRLFGIQASRAGCERRLVCMAALERCFTSAGRRAGGGRNRNWIGWLGLICRGAPCG
jgi:hypothetical protein